jgi:succinate dehydrogenase / fumarate reductase cytochrome b subunit
VSTATAATPKSFLDRHYHLIRRLHSLSGVFPIGLFLIPHLTTNSSILWGKALNGAKFADRGIDAEGAGVATFQHEVDFIHGLPALIFIEVFVLWLPILFHAGVGVWFARTGRFNTSRYAYQDNWRYVWQRLSGYLGVLFIFMHVSSLRWGWNYGGLMPTFQADAAASSLATHLQKGSMGLWMAAFYLVCVLALVFHFANGLWTAAITWGVTVSVGAQRRWGQVCAALGLGLAGAAVAAVFGFATLDPEKARAIENQYQAGELEREVGAELKTAARPQAPAGIESSSQGVTR